MEPIGTITTYFPFIDKSTREVLENTMKEASDYYDFVHRLCDLVLNTNSPIMVVYFAIHHSILALDYKVIDMIREKYGDHQILGPNLFYASAYQGTVEDVKKVHELADAILAEQPKDWICLEMNFMKFEADMRNYPATMYNTSTMDKIRELLESDPRLGFYETILHDYLAIRAHADGDSNGRIRCINRGLRIAEKFDDKVRVAHLLIRKANIVLNQDRKESRELLEQAYQIVDAYLGIPVNFADIIDGLSVLDAIRGEFDSAIRRCIQVVAIRERAGLNTGNASLFLSTLYNVIGDPESGLEWGSMAEKQFKSRPHYINRAMLNQIWSLILLKRLTEAQVLIDTSQESIMKSGDERQLAWLHFVTGIMEMGQGELLLALSSIEQALRIYEQQGWAYQIQLIFLYHLAMVEVYSSDPKEVVSPSLAILEEKALSDDLPGILGQVLLLKADISIMNDDESLLRDIIKQLRSLSGKENLQFLKPYYDRLLRKL
jgi:tetratricopeptide (TPR) repeat protein